MELLDVVDENNQLTGITEDREVVHKKGLWHREVAVWIMNEKGEMLVQKRAASKKQAPNKWGITAGHVDSNEEPMQVAKRETLEEIGLDLKKEQIENLWIAKLSKTSPDKQQINNYFSYLYFVRTNKKIEEFTIQQEELSELNYISIEELERIVQEKDTNYTFHNSLYMERLIPVLKKKREEKEEKL